MDEAQAVGVPTAIDTLLNNKRFQRELMPADEGGGVPHVKYSIEGVEVKEAEWQRQWKEAEKESAKETVDLSKTGALESTISLQPGWLKDARTYNLGTQSGAGNTANISIGFIKYGNRTIQVTIAGPFNQTFVFRRMLPPNDGQNLPFNIAWGDGEIKLSLCGKVVETRKVSTS